VQAEITLPPLRERGNDKILIANFILNELNRKYDQNKTLHPSAMALIQQHNWPGNIRQLRSALEVAFVYPGNQITAEAFNIINLDEISGDVIIPSAGVDLENEVIPRYYQKALDLTNGNATAAAKLLRIEPATFRARLRKLGIKST
jgi:DNA-binding NtrC family response regulator